MKKILLSVGFIFLTSFSFSSFATSMTESRGSHDASGISDRLREFGESVSWSDMEHAFDRATVAWLGVYGVKPFELVRPHLQWSMDAMSAMGWLGSGVSVSTAMLDARGDFAQRTANGCRVQINIDEKGSSPVLRSLGGKSSSIAFLAAHELAHCRFDMLSDDARLPTQAMLTELGLPLQMAKRVDAALRSGSSEDGTDSLLDAYDEALADAAATVALVRFEANSPRNLVGSAIDSARSLRLGMLYRSKRRDTGADSHQGGFVFDTVLAEPTQLLNWDTARRAAIQSVMWSSSYLKSEPRWWPVVAPAEDAQAQQTRNTFKTDAEQAMLQRNLEEDEDVFLSASSPAMFAVTLPEDSKDEVSTLQAEKLWRQFGWIYANKNEQLAN